MTNAMVRGANILIVDDQRANVMLLERILQRAGYANVQSTTDPSRVGELCDAYRPDLILLDIHLLDIHMPRVDGFAVLAELRERLPRGAYLPVLALTADASRETRNRALEAGARDFVSKP